MSIRSKSSQLAGLGGGLDNVGANSHNQNNLRGMSDFSGAEDKKQIGPRSLIEGGVLN